MSSGFPLDNASQSGEVAVHYTAGGRSGILVILVSFFEIPPFVTMNVLCFCNLNNNP